MMTKTQFNMFTPGVRV